MFIEYNEAYVIIFFAIDLSKEIKIFVQVIEMSIHCSGYPVFASGERHPYLQNQ
jgi:hypothetical protein